MQLYAEGIQWYDLRCDQQSYSNNGDWRFMNLFIGIRLNSEIRTQNSELVREFDWIRCDLYGADPLGRGCLVLLSLLRSSLHRLLLLLHYWLLLLRPAHITHLQRDAIMKWYRRIKCTVHSVIDSTSMCKLELIKECRLVWSPIRCNTFCNAISSCRNASLAPRKSLQTESHHCSRVFQARTSSDLLNSPNHRYRSRPRTGR